MAVQKVTKRQFIQAVTENEDELTNPQIAANLNISKVRFYQLLRRWRDQIRNEVQELAKQHAAIFYSDLRKQSAAGKTEATKVALEMAGAHVPRQKIDSTHKFEGVVVLPEEVPVGTPIKEKDEAAK